VSLDRVDLGAGIVAGFTTRRGGVSSGAFDSLNLADHVGDELTAVHANRTRLANILGLPLRLMRQAHGHDVHVITDAETAVAPDADALVTSRRGLGLSVLVADCVPVLLSDPEVGVVAAVHAGRRGVVADVVGAAVVAMQGLGADTSRMRAALGPAICPACYPVGADVQAEVVEVAPEAAAVAADGSPAVDLRLAIAVRLARLGIQASVSNICTAESPRHFSYRRDRQTGRTAGVIGLLQ
jgi:hypothetical protein